MAQYNIGDTVVALYDFPKQEQEDLNVWNGDTLRVINNNVGEGWLLLENIYTNEQGLVPEGYVQFQREAIFVIIKMKCLIGSLATQVSNLWYSLTICVS